MTDPRPTHADDAELWQRLATMWEARDPMPEGLAEQVLVSLAIEDLDEEYELLHLVQRSDQLAGVRSVATDSLTVSFSGSSFSLLLRISPVDGNRRRVDGWVTPARVNRVTARASNVSVDASVDDNGRFEIPSLPSGLTRFWLLGLASEADAGAAESELFATPTVEL